MRLAFRKVALDKAARDAERHARARGQPYDPARFPASEGVRDLPAISLEALRTDHRSGVYLIAQDGGPLAYVGVASDLAVRFYHGRADCKTACPPTCGCFGHINATPRTCRSHRIIEACHAFTVHLLHEMPYEMRSISQAEVDWYYLLQAHEWQMVNADWALGVAGFTGRPVVSYDIEGDRYYHFATIGLAAQRLRPEHSGGAGAVGPMVSGFQNQDGGFTHRYATPDEVESWAGREDIDVDIRAGSSVVSWSDGYKRNSKITWSEGPLRASDVAHLKKYRRGTYAKGAIPVTPHRGVSWCVDRWQCRAQFGRASKELWQTNRKAWTLDRAADAAKFREEKILAEGWQEFNTGDVKGSNAELLNRELGTAYADWEASRSSKV